MTRNRVAIGVLILLVILYFVGVGAGASDKPMPEGKEGRKKEEDHPGLASIGSLLSPLTPKVTKLEGAKVGPSDSPFRIAKFKPVPGAVFLFKAAGETPDGLKEQEIKTGDDEFVNVVVFKAGGTLVVKVPPPGGAAVLPQLVVD